MPNWFTRLGGAMAAERKSLGPQSLMTLTALGDASWSRRGFVSLANAGYARNPVVYRCVRMIAEAANRVPLAAEEGGRRLSEHPVLALLGRPKPPVRQDCVTRVSVRIRMPTGVFRRFNQGLEEL